MEFIDTHAHLYDEKFNEDIDDVIAKAKTKGIQQFCLPNIDVDSIEKMYSLCKRHEGVCHPMLGLHPCYIKEDYKKQLGIIENYLDRKDYIAIGEIGIDLYWDKTFLEEQKDAFLIQCQWAYDLNLPIVIHARDSLDILIQLVGGLTNRPKGIFHCFGGTVEQANQIIDLGYLLGIGGVLTFKKSGLDNVLEEISLEHLVLETDAPYLAPTPYRGKRNESAYIHEIATKLSEVKQCSLEEISLKTTSNAKKIFNLT